MTDVRFPDWRERMIEANRSLSDLSYQQRVWIAGKPAVGEYEDNLEYQIHELFDDSEVLPEPGHRLGILLRNQAEVEALRPLGRVLNDMIDDLGDASDAEYLSDPRWSEVVRDASDALRVLTSAGGS